MRTVLQLVALDARVRLAGGSHNTSDGLNKRLLNTLKAGYRLNTSRLQLLNLLDVQSSLERLRHVAPARRGSMQPPDLRKLEQCLTEVRRSLMMAGEVWNLAGSAFTHLTRLLPVQLEGEEPRFEPIESEELQRLALFNASIPIEKRAPVSFSEELARYKKAAADVTATTARVARAGETLRNAENGFRVGVLEAHELASALLEHSQRRRELMQRKMRACVARDTLYALAGLLPKRLGLS
ncbi:hypothetical protein [Hydrogenophaga sp. BPS33]|uniref:hypothetical protein n=1 Tax=Hydrogenophaga sp. BPS33 TaxID=2651974 RepID=UPI00131FA86D|nr:hypothetical protein [Hydrogenophaga sp. BPS33]QHE88317.1 hypothetical protein F9K07_27275 [Hydrogenophaga sp. BPS33]